MAEQQFTRQTHNTSYVAYTKAPSKPVPVRVGGGEVENLPVHSQVFIREFMSIEIDSVDSPRSQEQRSPSLYVKLNAASAKNEHGETIGLRENFGASIQAGGELENAVRHAHANKTPLYVAIETKRKYRNLDKEVISYLTPINELRGATKEGKGTESSAGMTRSNCSNVIVAIGPAADPHTNMLSGEAVTDPLAWATFRNNHAGELVPAGYTRVADAEGQPTGAIIERAAAPAPAATTVDVDALADAVAARLLTGSSAVDTPPAATRPQLRNARSREAKPWEPFNSDGRVNAGSYLTSGWRNTWAGAMILLENALYTEQDLAEQEQRAPRLLDVPALTTAATSLTNLLLEMADQVQAAVVGAANRMDRSHGEAGRWVHQIASRLVPFGLQMLSDDTARDTWRKTVVAQATAVFGGAMQSVAQHLDEQYGDATPINDASKAAASQAAQQARQQERAAANQSAPAGQETAGGQSTAANTPEALAGRWQALIAQCKLRGHEDRVVPFLVKVAGTGDVTQIPAAEFADMLTAWESNPQRFVEFAATAYQQAQPQPQPA
ncbi:hypothetical protein [Prescottella subtropica]|uniref:hypothetical protein n=1 Tax=Prescottella subtropica TaxID=2545757 RepID=UPI0010F5450B|nr:hypothetical protein [Prescottella subtropica]